jgi:ribosomal protein L11 methyltransferase
MVDQDAKWLEVSLETDGEYAEVVAEVLARFVPGGVALESTAIKPDLAGAGTPTGLVRVRGFIPVDVNLEETRRKLEEALWYLGRIRPEQPLPSPQFKLLPDINWVDAWKQYYHPILIGKKLMVVPAWLDPDTQGRVPIIIDPGMAFGTGTHPTTQLCLEMVEAHLRPDVLDIGCGSGILGIAALKLGADKAVGVDIDAEAIDNARLNALVNGVGDRIQLEVGSLSQVLQGYFALRKADLVLANILAPILAQLLDEGLAVTLNLGGILVLSGILIEQWETGPAGHDRPPLKETITKHGLEVIDLRQNGDWIAAALTAR